MDVVVRIAGEAGQGVETAGGVLADALAGEGVHIFVTQTYMSRIRGGLNWVDVRIGDRELFSGAEKADLVVALSAEGLQVLGQDVTETGKILFDGKDIPQAVCLPFSDMARKLTGSRIMANTVAAGAVFVLLGYEVEGLCRYLTKVFGKKGREVAEQNVLCARRGAELAMAYRGAVPGPRPVGAPPFVYSGNEALGLGAATAGVKFATAYPMTPSTGIMTFLAGVADDYGIVVEQAEDEIAAVNMVCGAVYAGVPALTVTSGGGFALMTEGVSLAGMLELPLVIVLAQRPGPATGLPTRTAQQDLRFALHAGHGEFPRAIYAPGSVQQAYELMRRAQETAHRFQTPVILLSDQFLADQRKNLPRLDGTMKPINRHVLCDAGADYVRYKVTESGISPRAIPGSGTFVVCDSDEHTEDGHITEDLRARVRLQNKRMAKEAGMQAEALLPELYGVPDAECTLLAWGSTYGPCREAVDILTQRGVSAAMVHFSQVWPIHGSVVKSVLFPRGWQAGKRIVSVEGNATGQFASVLREQGVLESCEYMLRYDGLPFTGEEIARRLKA